MTSSSPLLYILGVLASFIGFGGLWQLASLAFRVASGVTLIENFESRVDKKITDKTDPLAARCAVLEGEVDEVRTKLTETSVRLEERTRPFGGR